MAAVRGGYRLRRCKHDGRLRGRQGAGGNQRCASEHDDLQEVNSGRRSAADGAGRGSGRITRAVIIGNTRLRPAPSSMRVMKVERRAPAMKPRSDSSLATGDSVLVTYPVAAGAAPGACWPRADGCRLRLQRNAVIDVLSKWVNYVRISDERAPALHDSAVIVQIAAGHTSDVPYSGKVRPHCR